MTNYRIKVFCVGFVFLWMIACKRVKPPDWMPNILWITCEDISPFLGCYGDSLATTPNLDQMAENGIRYSNFYANAPVCAPARFTILTGVHASSAGTMNMRSSYRIPTEWKPYPVYLKAAGYYCTNNSKQDYNYFKPGSFWDESSNKAHYKNRAPGQPFFAIFNLNMTHESRVHRYDPEKLIHDPNQIKLPPYVPDLPEIREDMAKLYDNITLMDTRVGELLAELDDYNLADSTIVFFYSDHGGVYPRAKRFIYRTGTWVPLIIKYPEAFSYLSGMKNGSRETRSVSFVDLAPTLLSLAGIKAPEYMEGKAFLGEYEQKQPEEIYLFRNRMDERIDFMRAITDGQFRYQINLMPQRPYGQHLEYLWRAAGMRAWEKAWMAGLCNKQQSAFWKPKPFEELYDVTADPWEVHNLADDPDYSGKLVDMRQRLYGRMMDLHDAGFIPEGMLFELNDTIIPFDFTHSKDYPLNRILSLMFSFTASASDQEEAIINGLQDENPIVRFWACVRCLSLSKPFDGFQDHLENLLEDESTEVCLAAGEAFYYFGNRNLAFTAIRRGLMDENPRVVLMAFNILDYMDVEDQRKFIREVEQVHRNMDDNYVNRMVQHFKVLHDHLET